VGTVTLLLIFGLVMVLSSSAVQSIANGNSPYAQFLNQAQFALMGLPVLLIASRLSLRTYKRLAWPALILALALQALTFFPAFALSQGGNTGWIRIPGINLVMQPAEVGKLALAIWLGMVLGSRQHMLGRWSRVIFPAVPGAVAVIGFVLVGHDLGTALVIGLLALGAFWVAGASGKLLGLGAGFAMIIVGYLFIHSQANSNRLNRILATYGSGCDVAADCYQFQHGQFALGSGGVFGVGLGASREKWGLLPEAHNDFIYAIIGEELGLFGTLMVLGLFVALGVGMTRVIRRHKDPFVQVTTAAVACWVVGQAFINIGVVIGVFPVIGLPLPLVSAGGSALITTMAALGMVISFARTEPGAEFALAARRSAVRQSVAVLGGRKRGKGSRR
jgi:cell division protein FtsW